MIVQDFHMDEYMEYQKERAFHCLHARADIPSGVQKYPKTPNRVKNTKWPQKYQFWNYLHWTASASPVQHFRVQKHRSGSIVSKMPLIKGLACATKKGCCWARVEHFLKGMLHVQCWHPLLQSAKYFHSNCIILLFRYPLFITLQCFLMNEITFLTCLSHKVLIKTTCFSQSFMPLLNVFLS